LNSCAIMDILQIYSNKLHVFRQLDLDKEL